MDTATPTEPDPIPPPNREASSPAALRSAIERMGITQARVATLLGVQERSVRRWLAGERAIDEAAWRLLDVLEHVPGTIQTP